ISSFDGLNRYDGRGIKEYRANRLDTTTLSSSSVTSNFFSDLDSNLWFSTSEGIQRYDYKYDSFTNHKLACKKRIFQSSYQLLHLDNAGKRLWLRVEDTLLTCSINNFAKANCLGVYPLNILSKVEKSSNGKDWLILTPLSGKRGLIVNRFNDHFESESKVYLEEFKIVNTQYQNETTCWVGTELGLVKLNLITGEYELFDRYRDKRINTVQAIAIDEDEKLIVATLKSGLFIFDILEKEFIDQFYRFDGEEIYPFTPHIESVCIDSQRTLWISTQAKGIYFTNIEKKRFVASLQYRRNLSDSLQQSYVKSITEDSNGNIWCLTDNGIAVLNDRGEKCATPISFFINSHLFKDQYPYFIYSDNIDRIWVATQNGLFVLPPFNQSFQRVSRIEVDTTLSKTFTCITQLSDNRIVVSSRTGIHEVQAEGEQYFLKPFILDYKVYSWIKELEVRNQVLIREVEKRFIIYNKSGNELRFDSELIFKPFVNFITADSTRNLHWIATSEGLFKLELDKDTIIQDYSFPYLTINGILLNNEDQSLWLSTNRGLVNYHPESKKLQLFDATDGLQAEEFNFWSAKKSSKGQMIFGGVNGVNIFSPSEIETMTYQVSPTITALSINDLPPSRVIGCNTSGITNLPFIKKIKLSRKENTLSFRFAALDYMNPAANKFRHRMVGIDENWVEAESDNFARYPELPHGEYTFEVQATNSDEVWSPSIASLEIIIPPPIYLTKWFQALSLISMIGAVYAIMQYRVNLVRRKAATASKIAFLQKKQAEYKQKVAETQLAVNRIQMKPHVFFNALVGIKNYIQRKDTKLAIFYLDKSSSFMRMILKYGDKSTTSISQEIKILESYLSIQSIRFEGKYEYDIGVSEEIDPDEIGVPTMILQPFVENAILHGIRHKKEKGTIKIIFEVVKERLICIVEDDGIGRAASAKINVGSKKHESQATIITQSRLSLLKSPEGNPPSLEIIDLFDKVGVAAGTRVKITLPIL
ncbi:MAG: triple tyrosine motif-containing protein, partial [Bacteroidota bacterium]